jgi:hypothetical protein
MKHCGVFFTRLADGAFVECALPNGHNCAHSWKDPALTKRPKSITSLPAARNHKGKARAARKEAPMSPTTESLKLPPTLTLRPREANPRSTDEAIVVRDRDGRTVARIDVLRVDLLPN